MVYVTKAFEIWVPSSVNDLMESTVPTVKIQTLPTHRPDPQPDVLDDVLSGSRFHVDAINGNEAITWQQTSRVSASNGQWLREYHVLLGGGI